MRSPEVQRTTGDIGPILETLKENRIGTRRKAEESLLHAVYKDLHRMARRMLKHERAGHSLCPTALVHDTYLRLFDKGQDDWKNRAHFFGCAARAMHRVLIDYARRKRAGKRIPPNAHVPLESARGIPVASDLDMLLALRKALKNLTEVSPRQARIVEMRHIAGWTEGEVAQILNISRKTVGREWRVARLWLHRKICHQEASRRRRPPVHETTPSLGTGSSSPS